ncbi:nitroreductase family protein [Pseudomonas sp. efr-133-TYG-103a]|uniref:nitroreductase family protein n=1 Tax=Pseudomonas sp. efr-133-TYG-103a TaxID=3040308 RepID=UPI002552D14D|nr:nitroreductase family protein [Pseudomonas sp. efr-133-TYG-103a]
MTEGCRAFEAVIRERRATRQFLPTPLTSKQIRAVLADAQNAPSNCNTQPWLAETPIERRY